MLDWNIDHCKAANKCTGTHCGNFPKSLLSVEPEVSNLDALGTTIGPAVIELPRMCGQFTHLCREGFERHVGMVRGNYASVVEEAVSGYLKWDLNTHV